MSVSLDFPSNCGVPGANRSASLSLDSSLPPEKIALSVSRCLTRQCSWSEVDGSCATVEIPYYGVPDLSRFLQHEINPQSSHSRGTAGLSVLLTLWMYQSRTMYSKTLKFEAVFLQLSQKMQLDLRRCMWSVQSNVKGKRVFDKKHCCLYGSKASTNLTKHLFNKHQDEECVKQIMIQTKMSQEWKLQLELVRNLR